MTDDRDDSPSTPVESESPPPDPQSGGGFLWPFLKVLLTFAGIVVVLFVFALGLCLYAY